MNKNRTLAKRNANNKQSSSSRQKTKAKMPNRVNSRRFRDDEVVDSRNQSSGISKDGTNDVSWYANNPELLRAAASLPFSVVNGQLLPTLPTNLRYSIPNTMALQWNPVIAAVENDAINQAANSMYSFVVHANSRNYKYSASDLMILIQAGASFFSMLALGIRTYGCMRLYDQRNKFLPKDWVQLSGFNFEDLKNNMSRMWFDLNQLIAMSQQIWIPNTMPAITRWFWLNTNIYMDANTAKAQYYMFVPFSYLQYEEVADVQGGCLLYKAWANQKTGSTSSSATYKTWDEYMTIMNTMLRKLVNSEDRGIIFGDILKAYGSEHIYSVSPISADYTITPVYNPEVLTQIENCNVWPFIPTCSSSPIDPTQVPINSAPAAGIYQDQVNNVLYQKLSFVPKADLLTANSVFWKRMCPTMHPILNFHQLTTPTPEQIMVATRLTATGVLSGVKETFPNNGPDGVWISPAVCGTEYICRCMTSIFEGSIGDNDMSFFNVGINYEALAEDGWLTRLSRYMAFDWAPIWYIQRPDGAPLTAQEYANLNYTIIGAKDAMPQHIFCEYDNWTTLDLDILQKMHTAAVYSEFGVPVRI